METHLRTANPTTLGYSGEPPKVGVWQASGSELAVVWSDRQGGTP